MDETTKICRFCGTTLPGDSNTCEYCGAPATLQKPPPQPHPSLPIQQAPLTRTELTETRAQTPTPPKTLSAPEPPSQQERPPQKANACLIVLGAVGLALICLSFLALAIDYIGNRQILKTLGVVSAPSSKTSEIELPTAVIQAADPTAQPTPVQSFLPLIMVYEEDREDVPGAYPTPETGLAEAAQNQPPMEQQFFDDFSTTANGWAELSTDISEFSYSNEAYAILVKSPSYIAWSELPIGFYPNRIEFQAYAAPDHYGGSFGVMCQFQDDGNYYSVEFDLEKMAFSIATIQDYKIYPLTKTEWLELRNIIPSQGSTNHFLVECLIDQITVYVNGERIGISTFEGITPFSKPGSMALFVATWEEISSNGYQIFFDNVAAQISK